MQRKLEVYVCRSQLGFELSLQDKLWGGLDQLGYIFDRDLFNIILVSLRGQVF